MIFSSYTCSLCRRPADIRAIPRINSKLTKIDPSSDALTIRICPSRSINILSESTVAQIKCWDLTHRITISTRFPNVIFKKAPIPFPRFWATHSVEYVSNMVRGIIAIAFNAKINVGFFNPAKWAEIPNGTNIRRTLSHDKAKRCLIEANTVPSVSLSLLMESIRFQNRPLPFRPFRRLFLIHGVRT